MASLSCLAISDDLRLRDQAQPRSATHLGRQKQCTDESQSIIMSFCWGHSIVNSYEVSVHLFGFRHKLSVDLFNTVRCSFGQEWIQSNLIQFESSFEWGDLDKSLVVVGVFWPTMYGHIRSYDQSNNRKYSGATIESVLVHPFKTMKLHKSLIHRSGIPRSKN